MNMPTESNPSLAVLFRLALRLTVELMTKNCDRALMLSFRFRLRQEETRRERNHKDRCANNGGSEGDFVERAWTMNHWCKDIRREKRGARADHAPAHVR